MIEEQSDSSNDSTPLEFRSIVTKSPRDCLLELNHHLGLASSCFVKHTEAECSDGLPSWKPKEIESLAMCFSSIIVCLMCVTKLCNLSIDKILYDKMNKNNQKYPVNECRGKSNKYTAYIKKSLLPSQALVIGISTTAVTAILFFALGRYSKQGFRGS